MTDPQSRAALDSLSKALDVDRLDTELRVASEPEPKLFRKIAGGTEGPTEARNRLECLLAAKAWAEAALLLVELYLPTWEVSHLGYDAGEWRCSLSPRPREILKFEPFAEAIHRLLPLAILRALVGAVAASNRPLRPHVSPESAASSGKLHLL